MRKPVPRVVGLVAAATVAATAGAEASERDPVLVDGFGQWGLVRLGGAPLEFSGVSTRKSKSIGYRLPADARQGPQRWYLLRLSYTVDLARASGEGSVFVDGSTNGRTAVSVELEVVRHGGRLRVVTKTLDLTRGAGRRAAFGRHARGTSVSFFQNAGVRPGHNKLTFEVERYGDVKLRRVRILPNSGLVVSSRSPARLELAPRLPRTTLEVGETARVGYRLVNTGDRPAMDVVVGLQNHDQSLRVRGRSQVRIGRLERSRTGSFIVEARQPGRRRLTLAAGSSNANNPVVELAVDVPRAEADGPRADAKGFAVNSRWMLGGLFAVLGVAVYAVARRRTRGWRS